MQIWSISLCYHIYFSHQTKRHKEVITHTHLPFLNQDNKRSGGHERITHNQALMDIPRNNVDFFMLVLQAAQGIGGRLSLHYKLMQMKKHRRIKMRKETWKRKGTGRALSAHTW